jgi:general secretion pathway protein A
VTIRGEPERVEGYEPFFGLNEPPFSLAPDPRFLFASASHSAALSQVAYALERREPLIVITGEIGTGKTLLCRTVLQRLPHKTFLSVITDPLLERDDLLKQLLEDFGVISKDRTKLTEASRHELVQTLHAFLNSLAPIHAHAVVIVDEAQHLQPEVLEQIRLLSNIDDPHGTLLQIILVGQTDLEPLLARSELRQLQQRVSRRFSLGTLSRDEVQRYIEHRLALARDGHSTSQVPGAAELAHELAEWTGTTPGVQFTPEAINAVSQISNGVPRVINLLCDRSLEDAYASRLRIIDERVIHAAGRALGIEMPAAPIASSSLPFNPKSGPKPGPGSSSSTLTGDEPLGPLRSGSGVTRFEPAVEIVQPGDPTVLRSRAPVRQAVIPRSRRNLAVAVALALAVVAIFFTARWARSPVARVPPTAAVSSAPGAPATRQEPAPPDANTSAPPTATTAGTVASPERAAPPSPVSPPGGSGRFDIVVASFRTDARASSAADQVAALGLPTARRVADGWQQVLSGPFLTRIAAEEAQQRLDRAGLTGTQIVPSAR